MQKNNLDHIGIAVNNLEKASSFFTSALSFESLGSKELKSMKLKVEKLKGENVTIELIKPLKEEKVVTKFLEKRGEGIHHICFKVDNIDGEIEKLKGENFTFVYETSQVGAEGQLVNFFKPNQTFGILIELSE